MLKLLLGTLCFLLSVSANAQIINSYPYTFVNGPTHVIDANQMNAQFSSVASQVNANAAIAGTNSNITALTGLSTPISQNQGGSQVYTGGMTGWSANAQTLPSGIVPSGYTISNNSIVCAVAGNTNTGVTTYAVNSTTATNIYKHTPYGVTPLVGGEIV